MKKIWIILLLPFFLTGCFDYQELNNRAVISGVAIDYQDKLFMVDLEILNNKKSTGQEESNDKTYYISGSGSTLDAAFQDCHIKISKEPYYAHLKVLIMSEEVARGQLTHVMDYMLRDATIRNIFLPVVAKDVDAKEILESTTVENPVVATSIQSMLENNKANDSVSIIKDFENFVNDIIDPYRDGYINTITKENDTLSISGIAAFKDDALAFFLDTDEAISFNTLNNDSTNFYLHLPCENNKEEYLTINLYQNNGTSLEFQDEQIVVKSELNATIVEDSCQYDFRESDVYQKLGEQFEPLVEEKFTKVINTLKEKQTDLLGINYQYYKKYRTSLDDWYNKKFAFDIHVNINKNGLIFEVNQND